jgi:hypothetical protein
MSVTLSGSGQVPVQVIQTVKSDTFTGASTSFIDITGLSVTITPTSASNRILVTYNVYTGETSNQFPMIRLVRGSTPISIADAAGSRTQATTSSWSNGSVNSMQAQSAEFLDSPSTTSPVTYKLQIVGLGSQTLFVNRNARDDNGDYEPRTVSSITVMEISG